MTINTINVGAAPNDGNGDPARTAFSIHNNNFTDTDNMAALLAQTSATDTTAGRGLITGALGANGGPIFDDTNLNPTKFGFGGRKLGHANTGNQAVFEFSVPTPATATGATILGTFTVLNAGGGVVTGGAGITPVFVPTGMRGVMFLSVSGGLSGITVGDTLFLLCDSAGSTIEATFA